MELRALGRSGLKVTAVGVGCNNFGAWLDARGATAVVDKAIDLGINLFDTADCYGAGNGESESFLGKALGTRRSQVLIATKCGIPLGSAWDQRGGASRDYIIRAAEKSLRRLGTDYIDLYQIHRPDPATPIEESLGAMDDLVRQGKVRYIGHSNFAGWQVADAAWSAKLHHFTPLVSAQNRYSVLTRGIEAELAPACVAHGVGILPYFPLESGALSGKYTQGSAPPSGSRATIWPQTGPLPASQFFSDEVLGRVKQLGAVAAETGGTVLDLAFGWLLSRGYVSSVIAGATKPEQLEANVKAAEWRPTAEQLKRIDEISPPPG